MELFLIRHGQSANNALEDITQRVSDPELTPLGRTQAAVLATYLHREGHLFPRERNGSRAPLDRLYCSPMLRALDTALPVARALAMTPAIRVDIHEVGGIWLDAGDGRGAVGYPGQTRQQIEERFPGFAVPEEVGEQGWWEGGMEEVEAAWERAQAAAAWLRGAAAEDSRIGLVSHGDFMHYLLKVLLGQKLAASLYYEHRNTAITRLFFGADGFVSVQYHNRTEHLSAEQVS